MNTPAQVEEKSSNDSQQPLVSVLMPVYNAEKYLHRALDSIVNQTYTNLEIVVVNDGSTDTSGQIIDEYASKDPRIKVIHQENKGIGTTRQVLLDHATGEYIAHCDSDDIMVFDGIERLVSKAESTGADIVVGKFNYINTQTGKHNQEREYLDKDMTQEELIHKLFYDKLFFALWSFLIRRDKLNIVGFEKGVSHSEDLLAVSKILFSIPHTKVVGMGGTNIYTYIDNRGSTTKNPTEPKLDNMSYVLHHVEDLLPQNSDLKDALTPMKILTLRSRALFVKEPKEKYNSIFPELTKNILKTNTSKSSKVIICLRSKGFPFFPEMYNIYAKLKRVR